VVYGAGGRFAGSPFHQQFANGPASDAHFVIDLPADDRVLGASAFNKLHAPGNGAFDDPTLQREQIVYWLARKSGLPWLHRRYFHFCVNGVKKKTLMEDTQVGSDDLVAEFWPQDADGQLYKLQPWFEFPDSTTLTAQTLDMSSSSFVSFSRVTTTSNELKLARYRWNWLVRGAETTANNYSNVLQFINTMADTSNTAYETNVEAQADVGEWLKFFAINHSAGNWDSVGYKNQQNTYAYRPTQGRWQLIIWDANIAFGNGMSDSASNLPLFTTQDPSLSRWFSKGEFKRRFRTAYYELINGPLQPELISPFLDAKYAAFQEHGVTADAPGPIKTWITAARKHIQSQIANDSAAFVVTNVTGAGVLMLSGTGPLDMVSLQINGTPVPVSWTTTKNWTAQYAPATNLNRLEVAALNGRQQPVAGAQATIALGPPGAVNLKVDNAEVVLEYPATRPGAYQLQATSALASQIWQSVAVKQVITGTVQFRLPAPTDASVFYRVLEP